MPYDRGGAEAWNRLNEAADAGHFLFDRGFMEYHADRFADASLVLLRAGRPAAIFPANRDGSTVHSHQGLTFGGLVPAPGHGVADVLAMYQAVAAHARAASARALVVKALPAIYHRAPAEAGLYALFRLGARCRSREVTATIDARAPGPRSGRRDRGLRRASRAGLAVGWDEEAAAWAEYWEMLAEVLGRRHGRRPVHSLAEITLLAGRFPERIRLCTARYQGRVVAGVVVFATPLVAHAQYIAASPEGQALGALDAVFDVLIGQYAASRRYFDFGISTEAGGARLNAGLASWKQEWGAGCVVHDTYEIPL